MKSSDVPAGLALCRSAGWNQLDNDWNLFLTHNPRGNVVAIDESGKVVGTVATINYNNHFSWIGMVLVDPAKKRQGIGTQLLEQALNILSQQQTIKLDATPAGREVYLKLGFKDEYVLTRMQLENAAGVPPGGSAEKITDDTLGDINVKDETVFGAPRIFLLTELLRSFSALCRYSKNGGSLSYCFGRNGYRYTQIGPVVADHLEDAIAVTSAVLNNITGSVIMDVHDGSPFQGWLSSIGFTEQRKLIRMFKGSNSFPGLPEKQFAILGPELG